MYDVLVRMTVEVSITVMAEHAREAAHKAADRALDSLEGSGQRAQIINHEIVSTRAQRVA